MDDLLAKAKKAYALKEYANAVELYGQACGIYAEEHGQESPDLLYDYGRSLFQVAVQNSSLLNTDLDQLKLPLEQSDSKFQFAPATDSADIKSPISEEESPDSIPAETGEKQTAPESNGSTDGKMTPDAGSDTNSQKDPVDQSSLLQEEDSDDDFTAAWKILDLCRLLFSKQLEQDPNDETEKKLANTYAVLGEIALEDDNHAQAVEDFAAALSLKEKHYEANDRLLSEAHYMLALAHELRDDGMLDKKAALRHMQAAYDIAKAAHTEEDILAELSLKITDISNDIEATKSSGGQQGGINNDSAKDIIAKQLTEVLASANNISSLVKKRKSSRGETDTKRAKPNQS